MTLHKGTEMIYLGKLTMAVSSKQTNRPAQATHQQPPKIADHVAVFRMCRSLHRGSRGGELRTAAKSPKSRNPREEMSYAEERAAAVWPELLRHPGFNLPH